MSFSLYPLVLTWRAACILQTQYGTFIECHWIKLLLNCMCLYEYVTFITGVHNQIVLFLSIRYHLNKEECSRHQRDGDEEIAR